YKIIMLFRGAGNVGVKHFSNLSNIQLFASPEISYENAMLLAEEGSMVLVSDEIQPTVSGSRRLHGEGILRSLLKRRGLKLNSFSHNPSINVFGKPSARLSRAVRQLYDLLDEDVPVNVFQLDDFVVLEDADDTATAVLNLKSELFSAVLGVLGD